MSLPVFALLMSLAYLVAPAMISWGWRRWVKQQPRSWTIAPTLSFAGLLFASLSGALALLVIAYALSGGFEHTGGLRYYSPNYELLFRCIRVGVLLSLAGLVFSIGGVWRDRLRSVASTRKRCRDPCILASVNHLAVISVVIETAAIRFQIAISPGPTAG